MHAPVSGALARALERGRDEFNARFVLARRMDRSLAPEAVAWVLRERLAPLMEAVFPTPGDPGTEDRAAMGLYEAALDLCAARLLGPSPRHGRVDAVWTGLLPLAGRWLALKPRLLAAALSNAAHALHKEQSAGNRVRPGKWLDLMRAALPHCASADHVLQAGQVAAWRAGMAHYGDSARQRCVALAAPLQRAALGLAPDGPALTALDLADPWNPRVDGNNGPLALRMAEPVGGFSGFGGPFAAPPEVVAQGDALYVFDNNWCWRLFADAWGAVLKRMGRDLPDGVGAGNADALQQDGTVRLNGHAATFPELAHALSHAVPAARNMLAATLPHSHKIFLVAAAAAPYPPPPATAP